jgi:hypothetical protein
MNGLVKCNMCIDQCTCSIQNVIDGNFLKLHFPLSNPQMTPTTFQIQNLYSLNIETVPNFENEALNSIVSV